MQHSKMEPGDSSIVKSQSEFMKKLTFLLLKDGAIVTFVTVKRGTIKLVSSHFHLKLFLLEKTWQSTSILPIFIILGSGRKSAC